jgi:hypothetical protein
MIFTPIPFFANADRLSMIRQERAQDAKQQVAYSEPEWLQIQSRTEMHQAEPSLQLVPLQQQIDGNQIRPEGRSELVLLAVGASTVLPLGREGTCLPRRDGAARLYEGALLGGRPVGAQQAERALRPARLSFDAGGVKPPRPARSSSDAHGRGRAPMRAAEVARARSSSDARGRGRAGELVLPAQASSDVGEIEPPRPARSKLRCTREGEVDLQC